MSAAWFYRIDGHEVGPLEEQQLRELVRSGQVLRETLVRTSTSKGWVPAGKIRGLEFPAEPATSAPAEPIAQATSAAAAATPVSSTPGTVAVTAATPAPKPRTTLKRAKPLDDSATVLPVTPLEPSGRNQAPPPVPPPIDKTRLDASSSDIHGVRRRPTEVKLSDLPVGVAVSSSSLAEAIPAVGVAVVGPEGSAAAASWTAPPTSAAPFIVTTAPSGPPGKAPPPVPAAANVPPAELTPAQRKKLAAKRQLRILLGATGGTLVGLIVVGVLIATSGKSRDKSADTVAQADAASTDAAPADEGTSESSGTSAADAGESSSAAAPLELDGGGEDGQGSGAANRSKTDEANEKSTEKSNAKSNDKSTAGGASARRSARGESPGAAEIATAIKSLGGRWFDLSQATAITSKSMKLQVTGAWLDDGPGGAVADGDASATSRRRLCIELRLTNSQPELPLNYGLWNGTGGAGGKQAALLLDESDSAYRFVPATEYSDTARQTVPVRLKPGQSIQDLLVFELPNDDIDFANVRLLLPVAAVGQGKRHLGLKIPRERIADQRPVELAGADRATGAETAGDDEMPAPAAGPAKGSVANDAGTAKPAAPAAAKPAPKPEPKEETIDDLRRSIAETVREQEAEREKMRAEQRAAAKQQADADDEAEAKPAAKPKTRADGAPKPPAAKTKSK